MSKLLKLNLFLVLTLIFGALLTACMPQGDNHQASYNNVENPTAVQALVFANEAAVSAYSYNFANYRQNLQDASHYFTLEGWQNFQDALASSGNLKAVIKKKLVVSAVATGSPVILDQGIIDGKYTWTIQMPMLITYQSASQAARQHVIVKLIVVKTPQNMGARGLAVDSFVAQ